MQNLGQSCPNNCVVLLIICSKFAPKDNHQIARFHSQRYNIFQLLGTSPLRHPLVCTSAQLVLTRHQITPPPPCRRRIYASDHSILLVCLDYVPPPPIFTTWLHHCVMPMGTRDIKMTIFCRTTCPCF